MFEVVLSCLFVLVLLCHCGPTLLLKTWMFPNAWEDNPPHLTQVQNSGKRECLCFPNEFTNHSYFMVNRRSHFGVMFQGAIKATI